MIRQHAIDNFKTQVEKHVKNDTLTTKIIDKLLKHLTRNELLVVAYYLEEAMIKQGIDFTPTGKAKH